MNERTEQCLYKAGLTAQGCWDELDDYAKQGIEKFAELIVRECITVVGECNLVDDDPIANIKQHFGVK
jgi:hypothetical protein